MKNKLFELLKKEKLDINEYKTIFNELSTILDSNISKEEKEELSILAIDIINKFHNLEDLKDNIKYLYIGYENLHFIKILYEDIMNYDFVCPIQFTEILVSFLDYIENPVNNIYINNCYNDFINFENILIKYPDKIDSNGELFKYGLDEEIIKQLNKLKRGRNSR